MREHSASAPASASLTSADLSLLALTAALQITLCLVRSHGRLYWTDELLGVRILEDPSFSHMFVGWREGADGGGGIYYLLARLWVDLVGLSELPLRLFSTMGIIVSIACIWIAGRRYYGTATIAASIALVFFTSPYLLWQSVNGRFYGLLLASVSFASLLCLEAAEAEDLRWPMLILTALAHAVICGSHVLGMLYSAVILLATIVLDRIQGRLRVRLYLAALSGWIVLLFSYRAILNTTSVSSSSFWTLKPGWDDLGFAALYYSKVVLAVAAALLLCIVVRLLRKLPHVSGSAWRNRLPVYVLIGALLLAECVIFVKSRLPGISLFADRYLIPVSIATVFLLAELITLALPPRPGRWMSRPRQTTLAAAVMLLTCGLFGLSRRPNELLYPETGLPERIAKQIPMDEPVVVTALPLFVLLRHYEPTHRYLFVTNWKYDLAPEHANEDHSGEHLMENWKRAGYASDSILSCDEILQREPRLTILVFGDRMKWMESPSFRLEKTGESTEWFPFTIFQGTRQGSTASCH